MTTFTQGHVITIEIDGKPFSGSFVVDGTRLIVYADGYGQETTYRGTTADNLMAKMAMRSIIEKGIKT